MKGSIINVHQEGAESFIGCVLEVSGGAEELAKIVNLDTGEIVECHHWECDTENPLVRNVFEL